MAKILQGKVVSNKMTGTIIVEVERLIPHPLFKKLLRRGRRFKVATNGQKIEMGVSVKIVETRPVAKDKHFALHPDEMTSAPVAKEALPVTKEAIPDSKKDLSADRDEAVVKKSGKAKKAKASTKKKGKK